MMGCQGFTSPVSKILPVKVLKRLLGFDTQWRHKSKKSEKSEKLGQSGRQNMLRPYLKIWDWDLIFGCAVKAISSLVRGCSH